MKLVIVESPTKAKTLKKFLGSEYEVVASMGHVRDLPKSKLSVDIDHDFEPVYEISKGKSEVISKLKKLAKEAKTIYLATDPDREGEAIAYHLKEVLSQKSKTKSQLQFKRVSFHEITQQAIKNALENPGEILQDLVEAQQARRILDRIVGYQLSPVLWKKVRRGLSAGRVQSVTVKLIVEREKEIEAFKAQEYWAIAVQVAKGSEAFWADLVQVGEKKVERRLTSDEPKKEGYFYLETKADSEPIEQALKQAFYVVESVEKKERLSRPYPPYTTSTLQMAGANVLGWSGKKTMMIAQSLYEAGLITYHRTDSTNLAHEAVEAVRKLIITRYGKDKVAEKVNLYATKSKNAQEAHEAVRPSEPERIDLTAEANGYSADQNKLYQLIWRRFVACQMQAAIYDQTTVEILATSPNKSQAQYRLRASGSVIKQAGWKELYKDQKSDSVELPELFAKQELEYKELRSEQKFTQPPPRYNDASIVKELEKRGIGRPSTYAPTISTVIVRGYVERIDKRLHPTAVGLTVTEFLEKNFPVIMDYDFTAEMEEDLDRIARSEKKYLQLMKAFYKPFNKTVKEVEKTAERSKIPVEETGEACPECKEGRLVIRSGRFGKFISCSRFPGCKYTAKLIQKLENFSCPLCGGEVVLKRTKKGRTFWGCSTYPKCDYASWKDPRDIKRVKTEGDL